MRENFYKSRIFKKELFKIFIGAGAILIIVLLSIIIASNNSREQSYLEGEIKSMPLLRNETMKKLGDLYIRLNKDFENEIKTLELSYANRTNKRGDKIYYGVNGKENIDEMINDDYVNGIESITYVKGYDNDRPDGDSNFIDMLAFLTSSLGADIDRYDDEKIEEVFTNLFHLTHTFTGTSTELYPCFHGCAWCKYYCGDSRCQGTLNGNTVGFYKSDMFLGKEGQYGLMYDPFMITKRSNYTELLNRAGNEGEFSNYNKTTYQYKDVKITYSVSDSGSSENHSIVTKGDSVYAEDDEIYELCEPEGYCPICSGNRQVFTSTTKKFGGCSTNVSCHHGQSKHLYRGEDDETGYWVDWDMGKSVGTCTNFSVEEAECNHEHTDACDEECTHASCADPVLLDTGYYVCNGHEHYACPGHILVCCFGHTNLNLEIKIMYHQEMIETIHNLIN